MNGYSVASELIRDGSEQRLQLATGLARTPQGLVADATFFTGFVDRPDVTAAGLLAVADVAGSRYADVGLAQRIANLDPVVTASGDRLRFESFSACGGVHARFDLLRDGLGSSEVGFGTTNVDVNQALRTALARVGRAEPLHLAVGPDELRASTPAATHVERKVELPDRWVRGFAEVGTFLSALSVAGRLRGAEIGAFLAQLPRVAPPGPDVHVLPHPSTWRISSRPLRGSVPLAGVSRLRGADRVVRHAQHLTLLVHENGTTAWVFELPGARFTLVVSPGPFRGFSGEGTLLTYLTHSGAPEIGRHLLAVLGWEPRIDPDALATRTGLSQPDIRAGLAWLAASGRVGYDTEERVVVPPRAPRRQRCCAEPQPTTHRGPAPGRIRRRVHGLGSLPMGRGRQSGRPLHRRLCRRSAPMHLPLGDRANRTPRPVQARARRPHHPARRHLTAAIRFRGLSSPKDRASSACVSRWASVRAEAER